MIIKIYGLICPEEKRVMYIGKTSLSLNRRLGLHINKASKGITKKDKWITTVLNKNLKPEIVLLEDTELEQCDKLEKDWILMFGVENLVNGNNGGGGSLCDGSKRNDAYKYKFIDFLDSSNYSKRTTINNICYLNKFILFFKNKVKSPKEINSKEIDMYLNTIKNKNTRNAHIVALKLFYRVIMNQPQKLKEIHYGY